MGNKIKHLEFIQNVISRMNTNSFFLKGWSVTLLSALVALAAKDTNKMYVIIAYIPLPVFWGLDAFFLWTERRYRELYACTCKLEENQISFSMSVKNYLNKTTDYFDAVFSKTIWIFYITLILVSFLIICWIS